MKRGMRKIFKKGDRLYGYCNGYFGRDGYENKVCVKVTENYAIFEYTPMWADDHAVYAAVLNFCAEDKLTRKNTREWRTPPKEIE